MAPIDEVEKQSKIFKYFQDVLELANHYNINKDLFTNGFFRPSLDLNIKYENGDSTVYYGNRIPAEHTTTKPAVNWLDVLQTNVKDKYHTLIFVNLDGNFQDNEEQVMLWCVANATNNDVTTGTELVDYMQPFPMRGSGWHRCVYLLLEHESPIQFDLEKSDGKFLKKRSFNVKSFLNKHKEAVVPVGLSFFQTEWDLSVRDFFHKTLDIPEPVYKLKQEKKFIPKFEKFPKGQAFNWYLQEYNDRKDINEHIIKNYLKDITPLNCENTPAKYPILDVKSIKPRWLKYEIENKRLRKQEWNISPHKYSHNIERKKTLLKNLPYQ